jgi:hypothetical protein
MGSGTVITCSLLEPWVPWQRTGSIGEEAAGHQEDEGTLLRPLLLTEGHTSLSDHF